MSDGIPYVPHPKNPVFFEVLRKTMIFTPMARRRRLVSFAQIAK